MRWFRKWREQRQAEANRADARAVRNDWRSGPDDWNDYVPPYPKVKWSYYDQSQ